MTAQKLEITMPAEKEKIKAAYNRIFSDTLILKEQLDTAAWFEKTGSNEGQEW